MIQSPSGIIKTETKTRTNNSAQLMLKVFTCPIGVFECMCNLQTISTMSMHRHLGYVIILSVCVCV